MSTRVTGYKPPDATWMKHKKVYDACTEAGIGVPKETDKFFEGEEPDDDGVRVDIRKLECCERLGECGGFRIDVTKLPKDITVIVFENSW